MPLFLIPNAANLTGDTLASNVVNASINSITLSGDVLDVIGHVIRVGRYGSGTGGNVRFVNDAGVQHWLAGILGGVGYRRYSIYDLPNAREILGIDATSGQVQLGYGLAVTGSISATQNSSGPAVDITQSGSGAALRAIVANGTQKLNITNNSSADFNVDLDVGLTTIGTSAGELALKTAGVERARLNSTGLSVTGSISATARIDYPSYTVATLPAVGSAGGNIYVSDESGGAQPAFSDGTNWRRYTDRAIVS